MRDWASKMPGLGVITIEYSLAPVAKFPTQIQEALDVYLWLTSGSPEVEQELGFQPKKIVFSGDSSGGCMMMVLITILNDIRKKDTSAISMMPSALVGLYPSFTFSSFMYPSMLISAFHWILPPTIFAVFVEAYIPYITPEGLDANNNSLEYKDEDSGLASMAKSLLKKASWFFSLSGDQREYIPKPYYDTNDSKSLRYMLDKVTLIRHPYVSPTFYDDFESLKDIALYLIAIESDPILDHSILLAKNWKGKDSTD